MGEEKTHIPQDSVVFSAKRTIFQPEMKTFQIWKDILREIAYYITPFFWDDKHKCKIIESCGFSAFLFLFLASSEEKWDARHHTHITNTGFW